MSFLKENVHEFFFFLSVMSLNSTPFKVFVTGMDEQMNLNVFMVICKGSIPDPSGEQV